MGNPGLPSPGTLAFVMLLHAAAANAEWIVSAYGGAVFTRPADVRIEQAERATSLQFERVRFEGRSFESPIYYGYRVARAIPRTRRLFAGGELIHAKAYADGTRVSPAGVYHGAAVQALPFAAAQSNRPDMQLDHLVYGTTDLSRGVAEIEKLLGVTATAGGQHPGGGTRNALVSLGPTAYLEIIGPDPDQPPPNKPRVFGLDTLEASRLVTWSAKGANLPRLYAQARSLGVPLGEVKSGGRRRPDGVALSWQFTDPSTMIADGIVPFFIDWGATPHPAATAAKGASLISLRAEHPDAPRVARTLRQLGLHLAVTQGARRALIATIDSPKGRVELR